MYDTGFRYIIDPRFFLNKNKLTGLLERYIDVERNKNIECKESGKGTEDNK